MEEKIQELIHAAYDREISPADQALLDEYLRGDEEAQQFQQELHRLGELLRAAPEPEPPAALRAAIISRIPDLTPRAGSGGPDWLRPSLALAAAVVLALPVVLVIDSYELNDAEGLTGTMVSSDGALALRRVEQPGLQADLGLVWQRGALQIDIGVASDEPVVTTVEFPRDQLELQTGIDLQETATGFSYESSGEKSIVASLRVRDGAGPKQDLDPVRVTFYRNGEAVETIALAIPPAR